jgi:hypothetical protein
MTVGTANTLAVGKHREKGSGDARWLEGKTGWVRMVMNSKGEIEKSSNAFVFASTLDGVVDPTCRIISPTPIIRPSSCRLVWLRGK